jgi:4-amino-4-deoxy-L-arabinose transferase-like glycosyltransferase
LTHPDSRSRIPPAVRIAFGVVGLILCVASGWLEWEAIVERGAHKNLLIAAAVTAVIAWACAHYATGRFEAKPRSARVHTVLIVLSLLSIVLTAFELSHEGFSIGKAVGAAFVALMIVFAFVEHWLPDDEPPPSDPTSER